MSARAAGDRRRRRAQPWWARLDDEELLDLRFCDLGLRIAGSPVEPNVERLYAELAARGISFRPHCWFAEEWFSPDGVPGIAVPFYLAHPRLRRLERRYLHEVEGGNVNWLMRILRHEAGHAVDTAYRLRRRRSWREVFGAASIPYPDSYQPRPGSRRYVQHLGHWYAQSHPTEDFAETFAVWLKPGSRWRREYAGWPARRKLEYVAEIVPELSRRTPSVRSRMHVEPLDESRRTLREHYEHLRERYRTPPGGIEDRLLLRVFTATAEGRRAATLLRAWRAALRRTAIERTGCSAYLAHQAVRTLIRRAAELGLHAVPGDRARLRRRAERLVIQLIRTWERGPRRRLAL